MAQKIHYVKKATCGMMRKPRYTIVKGTLADLIEYFSYTLLVGNSRNSKISLQPKSVKTLVNHLNRACEVSGRYFDYFDASTSEEYDRVLAMTSEERRAANISTSEAGQAA